MKKPFIVANVREVLDLYDNEEISFSRMVEMLNEIAEKFYVGKRLAVEYSENVEPLKRCITCKHRDYSTFEDEPCFSCFNYDKWEPITT